MYNYFLPDQYVQDVSHITPDQLREAGIKGIITDLDNTLVEWNRPEATPQIIEWMDSMKRAGIQVTVVSNNNEPRVKTFCQPIGIPFIHKARKPLRHSFKRAMDVMGLKKHEVVVIGDQLLTDIFGGNRKGLRTILVVPVASSDGFFTRFNRMIERRIMAALRRKGLIKWEEQK